jgi:predicted nucleic acid-binding Zn ribbon protein
MLSRERAARSKSVRKTTRRHAQSAGDALQELVRDLGIATTLRQYDIFTSWKDIVGEQVAKVTQPTRVERGVLYVRVSTAPWRSELTMRRMEIRERINTALGQKIISEIRFR